MNLDLSRIDIRISAFLIGWHLIVLIGLPIYLSFRMPSMGLMIASIALLFATGMSITGGYHRLYAHRAYKASKPGELILLLFGTMAMQSSVAYWAHKHRLHHRFVDTEKDPHNIKQSVFHAHIGWLFKRQIPIDWSIIPDIKENRMAMIQHNHYHKLAFGLNAAAFLLMGWAFSDFLGAFIIGWWTRIFVLSHSTYFVNSLAHMWGAKTYSREQTAVNNAIVAMLTFGEGYHNYHHVFASDYRNGVRWFQYDPTKWMIWLMSKVGLTKDLKRIDRFLSTSRIVDEDKHIFLEALKESKSEKKHILEQKVLQLASQLTQKITQIKQAVQEYHALHRNGDKKSYLKDLRKKINGMQANFRSDWKSWRNLEKEISSHAILHHHHV